MNQVYPQSGLASLVASKGRDGDSMLIHMAPEEVRGLQALALAHGGSLTINPDTGLYEASFLKKLLPTLIGFGLSFIPGVGPLMAAGLVGAGETLRTGDLGKGLMAGFGAYGGAGLGSAVSGVGSVAKAAAGSPGISQMTPQAFQESLSKEAVSAAAKQGASKAGLSAGIEAIKTAPMTSLKAVGSQIGTAGVGSLGSTALNAMTPEMKMPKGSKEDNLYYISGGYSDEEGFAPGQYSRTYPGLPPPGMAMGGAVPRPNPSYPMANLQGASAYAAPLNYNKPTEVISGYDAKINPMTGQEIPVANFAEGGNTEEAKKQFAAMLTAPPPAAQSNEGLKQYMSGLNRFLAGAEKAAPTYIAPPPPPPKAVAPPPPVAPPPATPPTYGPIDFSNIDFGVFGNYGFDPNRIREGLRNFGYQGEFQNYNTGVYAPREYVPSKFDTLYEEQGAAPVMNAYVPPSVPAEQPVAPPVYWKGAMPTPVQDTYRPAVEPVQEFVGTPYMPPIEATPVAPPEDLYRERGGPTALVEESVGTPYMPDYSNMYSSMYGGTFNPYYGMTQQPQVAPMGAPPIDASGIASVSPYAEDTLSGLRAFKQMQEIPSGAMGEGFNFGFAGGGSVPSVQYAAAGKLLRGPGDGMSDDIPANIDGTQEARLADGEFVIPADVVSHLGNGSSEAGSKQLYAMMDRVRKARTGRTQQAPEIDAEKYLLA